MKISAKINTVQNTNILLFVREHCWQMKECLIAVWSDFWQDIIDPAINKCRKRLQARVRAHGRHDILNTLPFVNKLLQTISIFSSVFGSRGFCPSCQIFTVLMLDGR